MATLYVERVPDDLYEALRERARANGSSITAEVIQLLAENIPTREELARRKKLLRASERLRRQKPLSPGPFPSTEEMIREDRER